MEVSRIRFRSHELTLEGKTYVPDTKETFAGVVVCHPHPLYGGSMDNNVVDAICAALVVKGMAALAFNFRGVGASEGSFDNGKGEMSDVSAALQFLSTLPIADPQRLALAGYSAGSAWGAMVACESTLVTAIVTVSPPIEMFNFRCLEDCTKPKFLATGSQDELVPVKAFIKFSEHLPAPRQYRVFEGADHTWQGYEIDLATAVATFLASHFYN